MLRYWFIIPPFYFPPLTNCHSFFLDQHRYHPNRFKDVVLIGCGTGIAPLYQMAHMILANRDEKTKVWMVAAHRTEADILLREEFEQMAAFSDRFKLHVALSQPADPEGWNTESTSKSKPWTGSVG